MAGIRVWTGLIWVIASINGATGDNPGRDQHRGHRHPRWHPYIHSSIRSFESLTQPEDEDTFRNVPAAYFDRESYLADSWTRNNNDGSRSYAYQRPKASYRFGSPPQLMSASVGHTEETCPQRPRNWRSLFDKSRCKKKCKTVKNCGRNFQSKLCLCDGECGMSCVKKNLNCPPLMEIKHGHLSYTATFPFDSIVAYSCHDKYVLAGNAERRCQGNAQWSGSEPLCITTAKCGPPAEVPFAQHASHGQRQFDQGTMISYHCVNGYYLSSPQGLTKAKCLAVNGTAVWYGPEMICSPISCGHPGDPVNGERIGDSFQYPNSVRYKCFEGFVSIGTLTRRCLPNGRWSGEAPSCQPVQCPKPEDPMHGRVLGTSLDFRASITYTCEEGHRLVGQRKRVCLADRTWSGQPSRCEEIHCESPPAPENGYIEGTDTAFGAEILYRCLDDIQPRGAERARCQRDGTWSFPPPQCLANCKIPETEHGQWVIGPSGRTVHHGMQMQIDCEHGYEPDSNKSECNNGRWDPTPPSCVPVRCPDWPRSFPNSMVLFVRSDANSMARYVCKPGFKMIGGNGVYKCQNGNWTGESFVCKELTCENPRKVEDIKTFNGSIKLEGSMGTYEYHDHFQQVGENRQIQFECPKGFMLIGGPNKATCLNGVWMPRFKPVCMPQDHPAMEDRPDWSNLRNKRSVDNEKSKSMELIVNGIGESGEQWRYWNVDREKRAAATASGGDRSQYVVLSVKPPRKKRKKERHHKTKTKDQQYDTEYQGAVAYSWGSSCAPIRENERQKYAVIRYSPLPDGRFLGGSEVMIRCQSGYELPNPNQNIVVCKNSTWTPMLPTCAPKNCKLPVRPNAFFTWRGEIVSSGHEVGHREGVKLFCLRGYELRGEDALECNLGSWLKPAGECIPQSCAVPFLRYGHYKNDSMPRAAIEHASKVDFYCQHGFYPNPGQGEVHCSYGTLRPHDPECNEDPSVQKSVYLSIGCTRPYDIDNAWVYIREPITKRRLLIDPQLSVFPNRTIVHYKCSESLNEADDLYGGKKRRRRAATLASLYNVDEAHAIECTDGEWVALLVECAPSGRLPPGVESNSTRLLNLQLFGANKLPCTRPNQTEVPMVAFETNEWLFPHGYRLRVHCSGDETRSWYVRCRRGTWKGFDDLQCTAADSQNEQSAITEAPKETCDFNPSSFKSMIVFYEQRKEPIVFKEQLPDGARLTVRCQHVGLFQFTGTKKLICRGGAGWQGGMPRCRPLGVPWKEGQAPPIAYRAIEGDLSLTNDGDIVLRKSSTLELDCLVPRQKSQPYWDYSNSYRKYPQQWSQFVMEHWDVTEPWETGLSDEQRNNSQPLDAFRLTIFMARPEDSGIFHCITPSGSRHSIRVRVTDVDCPSHERLLRPSNNPPSVGVGQNRGRTPSAYRGKQQPASSWPSRLTPDVTATKGNAFGSILHFTCADGYKVLGASRVYCMENGEWSHTMPQCEIVHCPRLTPNHPAMEINMTSTIYDSVATFTCAIGFQIRGPRYVRCNETGDWSDAMPNCSVATCPPPDMPFGARMVSAQQNYTYGHVARFMCDDGYMQTGPDFAVCNQYGMWSNPPPECQPICLFPGVPQNGDTTAGARRTYFVGSKIVYYCRLSHKMHGRPDLECLGDGNWSADVPQCRPAVAPRSESSDYNVDFSMRPYVLGGR